MRFSASKLKTWMSCPLQAKFHYVDALPTRQNAKASFGTIMHHCLELYERSGHDLRAAQDAFRDLWQNPDKLGVTPEYWPRSTTHGGLRMRGLDILADFHNLNYWEQGQVIATEHPFLIPIGNHELTGFVDRLELRRSGTGVDLLRVVDYKTNSRRPSAAELAMNIQFTVYLYAAQQEAFFLGTDDPEFPPMENGQWWWETLADVPRRGIWAGLWTGSEHDVGERTEEDFERMYRCIDEVAKAIEAGIYVPNISGDTCGICDYTAQCRHAIPTFEDVRQQEGAWL